MRHKGVTWPYLLCQKETLEGMNSFGLELQFHPLQTKEKEQLAVMAAMLFLKWQN